MSIERCTECERNVDTDYDTEGKYSPDYEFYCKDCCEEDPLVKIGHEIRKSQFYK